MHFAPRRRLVIAILATAVVLLVLAGVGVFGLLRGTAANEPTLSATHSASPSLRASVPIGKPRPIPATADPEAFARSIARALIDWDTRNDSGRSAWTQVIVDVADDDQAAAVAADVRSYLPAEELWHQLGDYGTRQWLEPSSVTVPASWSTALEQASAGQIPPDAAAYTISGTRHREGEWNSEPVHTERPVAFTVFIACPDGGPCVLLRISQLDRPLE
jgi:hypothetical protein